MTRRPNSLHVISSLRLSSGGPTHSVARLCNALSKAGATAEIATVSAPDEESPALPGQVVHRFPLRWPWPLRRSPELARFLDREAARFDLIHVHGLWQWPGVLARRAARSHGLPLVISPRGMLEPWALKQRNWLKSIALRSWEGRNLSASSLLHATSAAEGVHCLQACPGKEIVVIPNGVDPPPLGDPLPLKRPRTILFLSRFHPKKGADFLVRAWAALHQEFQDWQLLLVGPDSEGCRAGLEALALDLQIPPGRIAFSGAVEGEDKWALLASAGLLVLPSHSENFGNVVLEALACGVPVLTTHGTPWAGLEQQRCGWWVPSTAEAIQESLRGALSLPEPGRLAMGTRGRAWAESFSWEAIAETMLEAYQRLAGKDGR